MIPIEDIQEKYGTEIALVLLCCRIYFNTENSSTLHQFINNNTIDWRHVRYLSGYHRLKPIVYQILSAANIPPPIATQIKQEQLYLIQQNFKQGLEAERIIEQVNECGIWCVPYKGLSFAKQFYGNITSRESSDIDLVIHYSDFEKVLKLMLSSGYSFENQLEYNYFKKDIFKREKSLDFNKYKNGSREFHVEFHWRISPNTLVIKEAANTLLFNSDHKDLFVKNKTETLNSEAHYLAVFIHHAMNDAFSVLRNIIDISQIAKDNGATVNMRYIDNAISDFNLRNAAAVCCYLSKELLGVILPFTTETAFISAQMKGYFTEQLLHKKMIGNHFKIRPFNKSIFYLKDNITDKANYLIACLKLRFTPSPKDIRFFKLPQRLYFLYALLKPFRSLFFPVSDEEKKRIARQQK